ncbi:hypothetical protein GCM10009840_23930 [Pseudolysinimonas kribbensis]|uniref:N-sulphoglucosamine sulphohydrolase C-terminal domain-containing protein n=1 Tax=Pseudolysinimonas kribbensis TaxID=433641 RepID=A0ABQ6K851_9MICO|nr:sulfatase/phosphatase domain-containing protein [Pseudolysinimonas kribbensis]GMA96852.1 hypothetical protein GCM10025881_36760 [Pseudolysinimonas kribbensis]
MSRLAGVPADERAPLDGASVLPLLTVEDEERPAFSEYHLEKVWAPCFMVRRGRFKYLHFHGHGVQLFDLEADPGEWHDLAGTPGYAHIEEELRSLLLDRFDPEQLATDGAASIPRRQIVAAALARNGIRWDYSPVVDGTRRYVR